MGFPHNRRVNVPCPTHSGRRAHKSCHFCRKPICRLCEVAMRGHLYCSTRCARDAGRHAVWRAVHSQLVRRVPARLAVAAVRLAACAPVILALRTVRELDSLVGAFAHRSAAAGGALRAARVDPRGPGGRRPRGNRVGGVRRVPLRGREVRRRASGRGRPLPLRERPREGSLPRRGDVPLGRGGRAAARARRGRPLPSPRRRSPLPRDRDGSSARRRPRGRPPARCARRLRRTARGGGRASATRGALGSVGTLPAAPDIDARTVGSARDPGLLRRRLLRPRRRRDPRRAREAEHPHDHLRDRRVRPAIPGDRAPHRGGRPRGRQPHGHASPPDDVRRATGGRSRAWAWTGRSSRASSRARPGSTATRPGKGMAPLWRAPFGEHNAEIRRWAAEQGYWHVGWTGGRSGLDGLDWITDPRARGYQPAERLLARLVQHAENGGIVLLHLGSDRDRARGLADRRAARRPRAAAASASPAPRSFSSARAATPRASRPSGAGRSRGTLAPDALTIAFGTDGWRGVIADDCTFAEIRRIAAATARWYAAADGPRRPAAASSSATIPRFLSPELALAAAEVFAAAGIDVLLTDRPDPDARPSPGTSGGSGSGEASRSRRATIPGHYNGFKVKAHFGGSAPPETYAAISQEADRPVALAPRVPGRIEVVDLLRSLRRAPRGARGPRRRSAPRSSPSWPTRSTARRATLLPEILAGGRLRRHGVSHRARPLFGGVHPEPIAENMAASRRSGP